MPYHLAWPISLSVSENGLNFMEPADSKQIAVGQSDAERQTKPSSTWRRILLGWAAKRTLGIILLGQVLALCITGTNTFTSLLASVGANIPGVQPLFNYALLALFFIPITFWKVGWRGWLLIVHPKQVWKFIVFAFFDVIANIFTIRAYGLTTILSAQLINFWAIVVVVIISFFFLKVRYHLTQIVGILVCITGTSLLVVSDHIQGTNGGPAKDAVKGDLFALLGATLYGFANVAEEYLVSEKPVYVVLGQLGLWGVVINGVYAAIFERTSMVTTIWTRTAASYFVGFTLLLNLFYNLAPYVFRLSSAAFFNISLLTANFWGLIVGLRVFGLTVHFLYPIVSQRFAAQPTNPCRLLS